MPNGIPRRRGKHTILDTMNRDLSSITELNKLPTDSMNLLNLLTLIVDIEYRRKYGGSIDRKVGRGYSKYSNQFLADQLPPIDSLGSARLNSMGDN